MVKPALQRTKTNYRNDKIDLESQVELAIVPVPEGTSRVRGML